MTSRPDPVSFAQEMARKNNENQTVHRAFRLRRKLRKESKVTPATKDKKLSKKALERLDWQIAEREARPIRAIGFFLPASR